jgi:type IV pilus assembly protein PilA
MRALEKKTKGFTLLELLVVIAILGILSATAYPNISSWIKERKVRQAAEKIKNLISGINTQVQRGSYEFVQVRFIEDGSVTIFTSGIGMNSLAAKKKDPDNDFNKKNARCNISNEYWDDKGSDVPASPGVGLFTSDEITINFADTNAVCFSKDGSYFSDSGIESPLIVCLRRITIVKCNANAGVPDIDLYKIDGDWKGDENYIYGVAWSRFGDVVMKKWVVEYGVIEDNKKVVIDGKWVQR